MSKALRIVPIGRSLWLSSMFWYGAGVSDSFFGLKNIWRETNNPNNIFFLFEVTDTEKARAFISNPAATDAAKSSGLVEGEYHFLESSPSY